jgi:hypothetical protein
MTIWFDDATYVELYRYEQTFVAAHDGDTGALEYRYIQPITWIAFAVAGRWGISCAQH